MRWVTATALLVVLAATPALALLCETRCETEATRNHTGHAAQAGSAAHAHHSESVQSPVSGLQSPVVESLPAGTCLTHVQTAIATAERDSTATPVSMRTASGWLDDQAPVRALRILVALRPPLLARTTAPLRI